jgi:hypothetical protein
MFDAAFGGKAPLFYHLSNIGYHVLSCVSLLWLLGLLGFSKPKSLVATLIFAVHPVMGHAVLWIPARGDLLVTLFGILSCSFFIRFLKEGKMYYLALWWQGI